MKTEEITVKRIVADDGKLLTDGEIYGKVIFLGANRNSEEFYEITQEEYDELFKEEIDEDIDDSMQV